MSSSDTGTNPRQSSVSSPYDVGRQQITQNTTSTSTPVSSAGYTNTTRTNDNRTFTITAATPTLQYGTTTTPTQQHSLSSARTLTASGTSSRVNTTKFAQGFGTATDPASAYGGPAASASASFGAHSHLAPASASTIPYGSRLPLDVLRVGVPQLQAAQSQTPQWTQPDTAASQWPPPCSTTPNLAGSTQWSPVPPAAVSSNNAVFGVQRLQTQYNVSGLYPSPALPPPVNAVFGGSPAQNGSALYPGQQSASNYGPYGGTPNGHGLTGPVPGFTPGPSHAPQGNPPSDVYRHLRKIKIPTFDGDKKLYDTWRTSFNVCVDQQPLSPELKLLQLRQYLSGPPLKTVETYGYSAAAYAAALQRLDQKYGGEKRKTAVHMSALQDMPPIRERGTAKQLERFADLVQVAKINLIDAGRQNELSFGTFCTQLQQKLSQDLLTAYHRWRCDNNIVESVDSLLQWLVREADFRTEAEETLQSVSHSVAATRLMSKPAKSDISTAAALTVTSSSVECVFCGSGHESSQCSSITDIKRRKELIRKNGRCFICLKKNHMARDCKSKLRCSKCEHRHHTSICEPKSSEQPGTGAKTSPPSRQGGSGKWSKPVFSSTTAATVSDSGAVFLQTAQTSVVSPQRPDRKVPVRVMLDGGSQRSYATSSVLTQLDVRRSGQERVVINAFGGEQPSPSTLRDVVELDIQCVDGNRIRVNCIVVPSVCAPVQNQHTADVVTAYESLQNLSLADNCGGSASIDILLGADVYWQIVTGDIVRVDDGPTALDTRLGWVLSGPTGRCNSGIISTNVATVHACDVEPSTVQDPDSALVQLLQKFWQLESIGILPNEPDTLQLFQQTIRYDGQRYTVRLPWREDHRALPDNYSLSEKRLQSTLKKLQKSPEILKEYNAVIQEQLQKGIIEEVPTTEHDVVGEVHYLPHHPVIRQDKTTTKVRVVYDASAKVKTHPSLNDCIHTGPPLLEQITSILLRFRTHAVAFTADIEKAFLMVGIEAADRDVLRFLWVDNPTSAQPVLKTYRFTRVVFGVSASPFLLNATLQHHLAKFDPEFTTKLLQSLYVDDVASGGNSNANALESFNRAKNHLATGGFNLRKFVSNSAELNEIVNGTAATPLSTNGLPNVAVDNDSYAKTMLNGSSAATTKVLGIPWDRTSDRLTFSVDEVFSTTKVDSPVTKRQVLSASAKMYDPLGLLAPITITLKVFHQQLCQLKMGWDDPLEGECLGKWQTMIRELKAMPPVSLPRHYATDANGSITRVELHGFCDASERAYAAAIYIVFTTEVGTSVQLVAAKTRVAPLKQQTIPRLELLSALVLARLMASVSSTLADLKIDQIHCWSDSQVALAWIAGVEQTWKQFVESRVTEIRRLVPTSCWRYCPTSSNPADLPSRGVKPSELTSTIWYTGPKWLHEPQPRAEVDSGSAASQCEEVERERKATPTTVMAVGCTSHSSIEKVIDVNRFSSLSKLLRVTAYVLKVTDLLKRRSKTTHLSAKDLHRAHTLWMVNAQQDLSKDKKYPGWCKEFGLFTDESGILRCGGRLQNAGLSHDQTHPVLLNANHPLTRLAVLQAHDTVCHNGVKETLTELRSRYWIIRGRQFVRKIVGQCTVCRRLESKPYAPEDSPPLPEFRTKVDFPFSYVGVDFAGPLFVREGADTKKVYIALFTCAVSRALHLDLVPDLSAETFLRCFKRFTARFGIPRHVTSDNAKTFKSAAKSLVGLFGLPEVTDYLTAHGMEWSFNLEKAPWWGGFYERMVRCVKRCLRKILGQARVTYEELLTFLLEVEAVLNSRPLTFVSTEDVEEPLTPSHLLYGRRVLSFPTVCPDDVDVASIQRDELLHRLTHLNTLLEHFWCRWRSEYLLELRNAHRRGNQHDQGATVCVGDVVVVHDDNEKRGLWRLALVEDLIRGKDNKVRGAVIKCSSRGGRASTMRRPVQRLYPVEVARPAPAADVLAEQSQAHVADTASAIQQSGAHPGATRPKRDAARSADKARQQLINAGSL